MEDTLINAIEIAFDGVVLGDEYTLLEEDFFDTHNRHFDGLDDQYIHAMAEHGDNLLELWGFQWPESSLEIGRAAIARRCKATNPFNTWQEVTHEYLNAHLAAVFLSPKAFRYYFPAAAILYVKKEFDQDQGDFIYGFLHVIEHVPQNYQSAFDPAQLECATRFLAVYGN